MSIALVKMDKSIKEIYGTRYINFSRLDEHLKEDFEVVQDSMSFELKILGDKREVTIIKEFIDDINYYNNMLEISKNSKYLQIKKLNNNESLQINYDTKEFINNSSLKIYKNYRLVKKGNFKIDFGDVIHIDDLIRIIIKEDNVLETRIFNKREVKNLLPSYKGTIKEYKDFPIYTNSPKRNYKLEREVINLELPPDNERKMKVFDIIKRLLPMTVTLILTLVIVYFKPRGPYIIITTTTSVMAITFTVITFIHDGRENKIFNQKRKEIYNEYLYEIRTKLQEKKDQEVKIRNYNYLSYPKIIKEIGNNSSRLYERAIFDEDFLKIRVGTFNDKPTYDIKNPVKALQIDKEEAELKVEEIYEDYKELENVPRVINLLGTNVGMIGSKSIMKEQTFSYILQLMFFQSYLDIKIVYVINEEELNEYIPYAYSRHSQVGDDRLYTFIYDNKTRDMLLSSIVQTFRKREESISEDSISSGPIFIFIISNYELIANHSIMEFLNKSPLAYGFTVLFQTEREEDLMNNIHTVLNFKNRYVLEVVSENKIIKNEEINIEQLPNVDIELNMRRIGQLEHVKGVQSAIPEAITYLEMYNVEKVRDLNIKRRWDTNRTYKSIKALLGKKSETDYLYLDLHEKVHGPHGLVAGTTGSGKSEVMQTYILSLMTEYSPYEVGFLLIDYKGGGMANLFKDAPHLLGSITNLDGYQAMRAMASIQSELKRRQRIFGENDVNHINGYLKLFERGEVKEPLPHLFLISDEFAELKANEPEFMKELVSAARIGRSLGVHLILATQKPTGVVDDQIWSNSKFKLCLKVAEESDSKELLKTPDAAYITQPGRGYLKVGTNELYELFQSGYSGADYSDNKEERRDLRVFMLDKMGSKHLINKDMSGNEEVAEEEIDELGAVVKEVKNIYDTGDYIPVKKPWLPPLEREVEIKHNILELDKQSLNLVVNIGLIDVPDRQKQFDLEINLIEEGNVGIFGGVQVGKTTTIKSIVLSLAQQNSPRDLCFYILDFGNSGLIALKGLKHTADYITIDDASKKNKLLKKLYEEIKIRKDKFASVMAANFKSYNELSEEKLPAIVVAIDNFDALRDTDAAEMDNYTSLFKEGASLGIYIVLSAYRYGALKMAQQVVINKVLQHYTQEVTELSTSLGKRSQYELQEIPGRVQLKIDKPEVAHVYLPVKGETEKEIVVGTQEYISKINDNTEYENEPLAEMSQVVEYKSEYEKDNHVFIGLDYEDILPQYVEQTDISLVGGSDEARDGVVKNIINQIKGKVDLFIIDSNKMNLYDKAEESKIPYYTKDNMDTMLEEFESMINNEKEEYEKYKEENGFIIPKKYFEKQKAKYLIINGTSFMLDLDASAKPKVAKVIKELRDIGVKLIVDLEDGKGIDEVTKVAKLFKDLLLLCDANEQQVRSSPRKVGFKEGDIIHLKGSELKLLKREE